MKRYSNVPLIWLLYILCILFSVGICYLLATSKFVEDNTTIAIVSGVISIALAVSILVAIVANKIKSDKLVKKYSGAENIGKTFDELNDSYNSAEANYVAAEKSVFKNRNRIILCSVTSSLVSLAIMCLAALSYVEYSLFSLILALVFGVLWSTFLLNLIKSYVLLDPERYDMLNKADFPQLYAVLDEVSKKCECKVPICLNIVLNDSVFVTSANGGIDIYLDAVETAILTKQELSQILLHEVQHVMNSDAKRRNKLEKFSFLLENGIFHGAWNLFFSAINFKFVLQKEIYYVACTKFYEQNADKAVEKYGDAQTCINATAKSMMLSMYRNEFVPERDFEIYASPKIPTDYYFTYVQDFYKYKEIYGEKWNFILTHRIPSRQDTHPTFNMRKQALGIDIYETDTKESSPEYVAEQNKLLEKTCKKLCGETQSEFEESAKEFYQEVKRKVDKFLSLPSGSIRMQDKILALHSLYVSDVEKCLSVAEEILKERPNSAYANYYKGRILASKLDGKCVECLYAAADKNFNMREVVNAVGEYACNVGDEKLLQEYREKSKGYIMEMHKEDHSLTPSTPVCANSLPQEDFNRIIDYILSVGKDVLKEVYSVTTKDKKFTAYLLVWKKHIGYLRAQRAYNDVFEFLDSYGEIFENGLDFSLYSGTVGKIEKKIMRTEDSLIYDCLD